MLCDDGTQSDPSQKRAHTQRGCVALPKQSSLGQSKCPAGPHGRRHLCTSWTSWTSQKGGAPCALRWVSPPALSAARCGATKRLPRPQVQTHRVKGGLSYLHSTKRVQLALFWLATTQSKQSCLPVPCGPQGPALASFMDGWHGWKECGLWAFDALFAAAADEHCRHEAPYGGQLALWPRSELIRSRLAAATPLPWASTL